MSRQQFYREMYSLFSPTDFEAAGDTNGKAIQEVVPRYTILTAELREFAAGKYTAEASFLRLQNCLHHVSDFSAICQAYFSNVDVRDELWSLFIQAKAEIRAYQGCMNYFTMEKYFAANPTIPLEHPLFPTASCPGDLIGTDMSARNMVGKLVWKVETDEFILHLLARARALVAAIESKEPEDGTGDEHNKEEHVPLHHPFESPTCALNAFIRALHLVLASQQAQGYPSFQGPDGTSAPSGGGAAHFDWSRLWRVLGQDIKQFGSAPEVLRFFYGAVELAARLERFGWDDVKSMEVLAETDGDLAEVVPIVSQAREHFTIHPRT